MFSTIANEYTAILGELYRLNGKGAPPVYTSKGVALQQIAYEAARLKNGSYGTFPKFTSEGQMLDDIATLLSGATTGGGETPIDTILNVPANVTVVSGTPTGTITCHWFPDSERMVFEFSITAAAAWELQIPIAGNIHAPFGQYFEHDINNAFFDWDSVTRPGYLRMNSATNLGGELSYTGA